MNRQKYNIFYRTLTIGFLMLISFSIRAGSLPSLRVDLTFPEASMPRNHSTGIPFQYYQSLIIIKASLGGQEGNFILDTGASKLVLNSHYFEAESYLTASVVGLTGSHEELGSRDVDTMTFSNFTISEINADVVNLGGLEQNKRIKILGLIGYEVLEPYELLIDYRQRYITLSVLDEKGNIIDELSHTNNKLDSFQLEIGNHIPVVTVEVDGERKKMGLDTGAEYNVLDIKRNKKNLDSFKISGRVKITGSDGHKIEAIGGILYRVSLNTKYRCGGMGTLLTNMDRLSAIYGISLDGILGHNFLAPWVISINYRKKLMYIHQFENLRS